MNEGLDFMLFEEFTSELHKRLRGDVKYQLFTNDEKPFVILKQDKNASTQ